MCYNNNDNDDNDDDDEDNNDDEGPGATRNDQERAGRIARVEQESPRATGSAQSSNNVKMKIYRCCNSDFGRAYFYL